MYGGSRVNVEVEPRSTLTLTHILFTHIDFTRGACKHYAILETIFTLLTFIFELFVH